jgi:hypothetical protein
MIASPSRLPPGFSGGGSGFRVKGALYRGAFEFYEQHVPGGLGAVQDALLDDEVRAFFQQPFLAGSWYDVLPMMPLALAAARVKNVPYAAMLRERGRLQAEADLGGIHKRLLDVGSPEELLSRLPRATSQYFDFGTTDVETAGRGHVVGRRTKMPTALVTWHTSGTEGYLLGALERVGASKPHVRWKNTVEEPSDGAIPTVTIPFEITWK